MYLGGYMTILLTLLLCIIPIMMIVFGLLWINNPPKKINKIFGYRSKRSMASTEAWLYAHRYFGRWWLYTGIFELSLVLIFILFQNEILFIWLNYIEIFLMLLPIIPTEISLKRGDYEL